MCPRKLSAASKDLSCEKTHASLTELVDALDKACDEQRAAEELISTQLQTFKDRLVPCESYYSKMSQAAAETIPDPISLNPFDKYFERLDLMVLKHIPKIYKLFKSLRIK